MRYFLQALTFPACVLAMALVSPAAASTRVREGSDGVADRGAIHSLEDIYLNGVRQTLLLRGDNRCNPILLYLHGGPGASEMPFEWVNRALERDFTIVHWDQRGSGKSFDAKLPCSELRLDDFVSDTLSLSQYLLRRFQQKKLFLVAHSCGSLFGALAVAQHPEFYSAYVGISQFVNVADSQRNLYDAGVSEARAQGRGAELLRLNQIGPPPYRNHREEREADAIEKGLLDRADHQMTRGHFVTLGLLSPVYSFADDANMLRGIPRVGHCLEKEIYSADLLRAVPRMNVPAFFFEGRLDTVLSPALVERYFRKLDAPRGKRLVWFEHADHWLQFEEREKYRAMLRACLLQKN